MRLDVLADLLALPTIETPPDDALMAWVRLHRIRGVGWVDAQLLLSALRSGARLWTPTTRWTSSRPAWTSGGPPADRGDLTSTLTVADPGASS
jgi:hypothetical protein